MKRIQFLAAILVGVLLLIFVGVVIYRLANPIDTQGTNSLYVAKSQPTHTAVDCPDANVETYLSGVDNIVVRWEDAIKLANSTARISLSPVVANLQTLRQEAVALTPPACAVHLKELQVIYMDYAINSFLGFMQEHSDYTVNKRFAAYVDAKSRHDIALALVRTGAVNAYTLLMTPQFQTDPFVLTETWQTVRFAQGDALAFSIPQGWIVPPADAYEKAVVKNPGESISLYLLIGSNAAFIEGKSPIATSVLLRHELIVDGIDKGAYGLYGNNNGMLLTTITTDGRPMRLVGSVHIPNGPTLVFDAAKKSSSFTPEEEEIIKMILASLRLTS